MVSASSEQPGFEFRDRFNKFKIQKKTVGLDGDDFSPLDPFTGNEKGLEQFTLAEVAGNHRTDPVRFAFVVLHIESCLKWIAH